jgi:hypothetical protein
MLPLWVCFLFWFFVDGFYIIPEIRRAGKRKLAKTGEKG